MGGSRGKNRVGKYYNLGQYIQVKNVPYAISNKEILKEHLY